TTADSNDSIAPSMAMVNADGSSNMTWSKVVSGHCRLGNARGIAPNVDSIVATPAGANTVTATVATSIASKGPGTRDRPGMRGPHSASARLATASSVVAGCSCGSDNSSCQALA